LGTVTRGLAAAAEPQTAVCLLPGTEVAFDQDVQYAHPLLWFRNRTIKERVARFRQVNTDNSQTHHDALEFPSGRLMLVTQLAEHQRLTVLQLPVTAQHTAETAEAKQTPATAR
jgi:hypothetical protein